MADLTEYLKHVLGDKADKARTPVKNSINAKPVNPNRTKQPNSVQRTASQPVAADNQTMAASQPMADDNQTESVSQAKAASQPMTADSQTESVSQAKAARQPMTADSQTKFASQTNTASQPVAADNQTESVSQAEAAGKAEKKMPELIEYLRRAVTDKASDLFIVAGGKVSEKVDKVLLPISQENVTPMEAERLITEFYTCAKRSMEGYSKRGDDDFSLSIPGLARFRVNTYRQRGSMAAVVRIVIFDIPDWRSLHIPAQVMELSAAAHGMVLVTGTAGSGKSTTQACIIDQINKTRGCHIITLEDPIEYLHRDRKSIISQREIAIDSENYLTALRACLRQAPDVILLGEMRDHETIRTAMTAAETGHLLIATLHTQGAVNTIDRIIDSFPSGQQTQIRVQLSMVLHTVVSQQLLPGINGELVPAYEIMCMNNAIRSLIRESKSHQIDNVIAAGSAEGMITMDQSILRLYQEGNITKETALEYAEHPEQILRRLGN